MHELGLVIHVIKAVEKLAAERQLTRIAALTLEIGEVSGVLPDYLFDCWDWAHKKSELLSDTLLQIEELPAVTACEACGGTYATVKHAKQCPHCQSTKTVLLRGNEFNIKQVLAC